MNLQNPVPLLWAGIDLAKATFVAALWGNEELRTMRVNTFPRNKAGAKALLAWLRDNNPGGEPIGLVMEATATFADELATWLLKLAPSLRIAIVNPIKTSAFIKSLGLRNKTDDLDARALAQFGAERKPPSWEPPAQEIAELRDLTRTRADLVNARTAMKLRLKDHKRGAKLAEKALCRIVQALDRQIKALDVGIQSHLKTHEVLNQWNRRFQSICGVALITSATVIAELGDLRRFLRSRQLAAFAGVSPKKKDSGTSVHGKSRMCKQGSARVRAILYLAAASAARYNPDLKAVYERLIAQGTPERSALGAVMRKLLILMRAVLKADRDWVPIRQTA